MKRLYTILVAFGSIVWFALGIEWFRGMRGVPLLREVGSTGNLERYPSLSVIVPARNEEKAIKESVDTMLNQTYPGKPEVIVIDDRSTDGTEYILQTLMRTGIIYLTQGVVMTFSKTQGASCRRGSRISTCQEIRNLDDTSLLLEVYATPVT